MHKHTQGQDDRHSSLVPLEGLQDNDRQGAVTSYNKNASFWELWDLKDLQKSTTFSACHPMSVYMCV